MTRPAILYGGGDPMVRRTLGRIGDEYGLEVVTALGARSVDSIGILVVDVDTDDGLAQAESWRLRSPTAVVMGHVSRPDPARWRAAERAGCDMVATRGAIGPQLRQWMASGAVRRQRMALLDSADIAGRLGFIQRVECTPVGALAVFRVEGALYGVEDRCPHAGSRLSDGDLQEGVVTCPGHGSQFDVCSGERLRGPADQPVRSHHLVEEGGRVYLEWTAPGS